MKIKRIVLLHGFNVWDGGKKTTGRLVEGLREVCPVVEFPTGLRLLLGQRLGSSRRARELAAFIEPGDFLIGHSDGCNVIDEALWVLADSIYGERGNVFAAYLNPALDKGTPLSPVAGKVFVYATDSDKTVWWSKFRPSSKWGQMGKVGYIQEDLLKFEPRYTTTFYNSLGIVNPKHSGVFHSAENLALITEDILSKITQINSAT